MSVGTETGNDTTVAVGNMWIGMRTGISIRIIEGRIAHMKLLDPLGFGSGARSPGAGVCGRNILAKYWGGGRPYEVQIYI